MYKMFIDRLHKENEKKIRFVSGPRSSEFSSLFYSRNIRVTRLISTGKPYPYDQHDLGKAYLDTSLNQPHMLTPWGKVLLSPEQEQLGQGKMSEIFVDHESGGVLEQLASIGYQLAYDVFYMIYYTVIALPSLVLAGIGFSYSRFIENDEEKKIAMIRTANHLLSNILLSPYFAIAIVVDFLREFLAIFTRTYGTTMDEHPENPVCTMG